MMTEAAIIISLISIAISAHTIITTRARIKRMKAEEWTRR
jgi:hypothetical protein